MVTGYCVWSLCLFSPNILTSLASQVINLALFLQRLTGVVWASGPRHCRMFENTAFGLNNTYDSRFLARFETQLLSLLVPWCYSIYHSIRPRQRKPAHLYIFQGSSQYSPEKKAANINGAHTYFYIPVFA